MHFLKKNVKEGDWQWLPVAESDSDWRWQTVTDSDGLLVTMTDGDWQ